MTKIVSVHPRPEYFSITWMLNSRCNYDCMYCGPEWHDTTSRGHDLDTLKQTWMNIHDQAKHKKLPFKISFTGGEVTADKNFLPLLQWLRENYPDISMILVSTNGSASARYYESLAKVVESITFSIHSEHVNEREFFNKIQILDPLMVRPKKSFHVNIMDEFWNRDRIPLYQNKLEELGVSYSVNAIDHRYQTREFPIMKGVLNLDKI